MARSRAPGAIVRRDLLRAFAGLALPAASRVSWAQAAPFPPETLDVRELTLSGDPRLARRALVLTPKSEPQSLPPAPARARAAPQMPVLVLLHGLGETGSEPVGIRAWSDRYGLSSADARLRHPPLTPSPAAAPPTPAPAAGANRHLLPAARLAEISAALAVRPYRGAVIVCPFTPNLHNHPTQAPEPIALDRYADWLEATLLPAVREAAPVRTDAAGTAIDGCSLGGYMAIEVFLRKPEVFGAVGTVQPAISARAATVYAQRLAQTVARVGPRAIHVETSLWDPERAAQETLSRELTARNVPHDYTVLPGGHDQVFLRERGTLEMLLWHDRRWAP